MCARRAIVLLNPEILTHLELDGAKREIMRYLFGISANPGDWQ
jgi:hypothetical protein